MNALAVQHVTKSEFEQMLIEYSEGLENTEVCEIFIAMSGSRKNAEAFKNPKGVGISEFSKLVKLPITTVRHYVEMGLVSPLELNSKFRFMVFNIPEIESVRQWRDLGLSLEDIIERRRKLGQGVLLKELVANPIPSIGADSNEAIIQVLHQQSPEEREQAKKVFTERRKRGESVIRFEKGTEFPGVKTKHEILKQELQLEYSGALEKLEQKKLELERRIAKAKAISEKLNQKPIS